MTDATYDARLARLLDDYGRGGVRDIDPAVVASAVIARARIRPKRRTARTVVLLAAALVMVGGLAIVPGVGRPPAPTGTVVFLAVDPDATGRATSAWRSDLATGVPTLLVMGQRFVSLAPDGRHVAYLAGDGVHILDAVSGADQRVEGPSAATLDSYDTYYDAQAARDQFVWSPGGRWVGWVGCASDVVAPSTDDDRRAGFECAMRIAATDGSSVRPFPMIRDVIGPDGTLVARRVPFFDWTNDEQLTIDPVGYSPWVVFAGDGTGAPGDFWTSYAGPELDFYGPTITTATGTFTFPGYQPIDSAFAPDAATLAFSLAPSPATDPSTPAGPGQVLSATRLGILHPDGSTQVIDPGSGTEFEDKPVWSPDGSRILAITRQSALPDRAAFIAALAAPSLARVDDVRRAIWSGDGASLVLVRSSDPRSIETVDADGQGRRRIGQLAPGPVAQIVWQR